MYDYYNDYMQMYYPHMMDYEPMRYPDVYYTVYPMVKRKCEEMDNPYNPMMHPYPSYEIVEAAADEIFYDCREKYPEILKEYEITSDSEAQQIFGRRRLFRDLISILLIRELLRRRGYGPGYGYSPGYGYGYGPGYGMSPYIY